MAGKVERRFEIFQGQDGEWWWRYIKVVGGVSNIMAGSTQGYVNKDDCRTGINEMRVASQYAKIIEV